MIDITDDHFAIRVQQIALDNAYKAADADRCAVHHLNLSNHLEFAGNEPLAALTHRLAAAVLLFQSNGDLLPAALASLAHSFEQFIPAKPPLPASFAQLCLDVEQLQDVPFRQMVVDLAGPDGADGNEALHAVVGIARRMASGG